MANTRNKNVDEIGKKMLKAIRAREQDIDAVIASEDLFDPVREAIRSGKKQSAGTFGFMRLGLGMRPVRFAFASIVAIAFGIFAVSYVTRQRNTSHEVVRETAPLKQWIEQPASEEAAPNTTPAPPEVTHIVAREGARQRPVTAERRAPRPPQRHSRAEDLGEFQAVTFTGDSTDMDTDGKIVRVELPRSSLFAMGIDVPVENQTSRKVKADLLIGEDGVMKAVRLVN